MSSITVFFLREQGAEELYALADKPSEVYIRQKMASAERVVWLTASQWQGGYWSAPQY